MSLCWVPLSDLLLLVACTSCHAFSLLVWWTGGGFLYSLWRLYLGAGPLTFVMILLSTGLSSANDTLFLARIPGLVCNHTHARPLRTIAKIALFWTWVTWLCSLCGGLARCLMRRQGYSNSGGSWQARFGSMDPLEENAGPQVQVLPESRVHPNPGSCFLGEFWLPGVRVRIPDVPESRVFFF